MRAGGLADEENLRIYAIYPRKVGRDAALRAIANARKRLADRGIDDPVSWLIERVTAYAASRQSLPADDQRFTPHPSTWFNQGRFDDSPQEWRVTGGQSPPAGAPGRVETAAERRKREFEEAIR